VNLYALAIRHRRAILADLLASVSPVAPGRFVRVP